MFDKTEEGLYCCQLNQSYNQKYNMKFSETSKIITIPIHWTERNKMPKIFEWNLYNNGTK